MVRQGDKWRYAQRYAVVCGNSTDATRDNTGRQGLTAAPLLASEFLSGSNSWR